MGFRKTFVVLIAFLFLTTLIISCNDKAEDKVVDDKDVTEVAKGKIAYVDDFDIWVMDADGGNALNLTDSPQKEYDPCFSPDGSQVAFTAEDGARGVFVINDDASGLTALTLDSPGENFAPAWSPDGDSIAFLSTRDHEGEAMPIAEVYLMDPDGGNQRRLSRGEWGLENPGAIWWLPDGGQIAVWIMGTGGGTVITLVDTATGEESTTEQLYNIFGEDDDYLQFVNSYVVNPQDENTVASALFYALQDETTDGLNIVNLDDGSHVKVSDAMLRNSCAWSKDGAYLYFTDEAGEGYYGFFMVEKDGSGLQELDWLPKVPWDDDLYSCNYADFHIKSMVNAGNQ